MFHWLHLCIIEILEKLKDIYNKELVQERCENMTVSDLRDPERFTFWLANIEATHSGRPSLIKTGFVDTQSNCFFQE